MEEYKRRMNIWDRMMFPSEKRFPKMKCENNNIIIGSWISTAGTIISAVASTPSTVFTDQTLEQFNLIGNTLEAIGGTLMISVDEDIFNKVGGHLATLGNVVAIAGILNENEKTSNMIESQGELLQVVGAGITIDTSGNLSFLEAIANIASIIQIIGMVVGILADAKTAEGQKLVAIGAWIEAIGAIISSLATEKINKMNGE